MCPPPYYSNVNPSFRDFAKVWTSCNFVLLIFFLSLYISTLTSGGGGIGGSGSGCSISDVVLVPANSNYSVFSSIMFTSLSANSNATFKIDIPVSTRDEVYMALQNATTVACYANTQLNATSSGGGSQLYLGFMVTTLVAWTFMLAFIVSTLCSECLNCDERANRLKRAELSNRQLTEPLAQSVYFSVVG